MDRGYFKYGTEAWGVEPAVNASNVPAGAGSLPTFIVLDASGDQIIPGVCTAVTGFTGLYRWAVDLNNPSFTRGGKYMVVVQYTVDTVQRQSLHYFGVS